ncbi:hypothetical protein QVG61_04085 [Thiohalobacter sp. IOR34]|uniref:hypothetical protein n=1 Tax=Thiohalobacter sp. IOR34 TaxID=3057176 RepID=UPI0025B158E9|nr:hypothetical protein [Thiohalobacter sp. IOR34]WJW76280.1 hypothetical protein QVG61_04085 [Thiohalobacter sp. IOR34]
MNIFVQRAGGLVFLFGLTSGASTPVVAGTGIEVDSTLGNYQDYDASRPYVSYTDTYGDTYSGISVNGYANAANMSLGMTATADSMAAGAFASKFEGRLRVGAGSSELQAGDPARLRLDLQLDGVLSNGALIDSLGNLAATNNDAMMQAGFIVHEGKVPLGLSLYGAYSDVSSLRGVSSLAYFSTRAFSSREALDSTNERYIYNWWWDTGANGRSGSDSVTTTATGAVQDLFFSTGLLALEFYAPVGAEIWVEGLLSVDVNANDHNTWANADFGSGLQATIIAVDEGIQLDYSVDVSEVPLPGAVWLFGSGLIAVFGVGGRCRHPQAPCGRETHPVCSNDFQPLSSFNPTRLKVPRHWRLQPSV